MPPRCGASCRNWAIRAGAPASHDHIHPWRVDTAPPPPRPRPRTVREVTGWITRHPATLTADEHLGLKHVLVECPELEQLSRHVQDFARLMTDRHGHELEKWMRAAHAAQIGELTSFITGLRRDFDAVRAGLSSPYSSGVVEGHINRLKYLKRQMYGRANPDLLRKRVILAN